MLKAEQALEERGPHRARRQSEILSGVSRDRDRGFRNRHVECPRRGPEPDSCRQGSQSRDAGRERPPEPASAAGT